MCTMCHIAAGDQTFDFFFGAGKVISMETDPNSCAICGWPSSDVHMRNSGVHDGLLIECPRCGQYEMVGRRIHNGLRK